MTTKYPGFDSSYIYRLLSDFWDTYNERDQLACLWGGLAQLFDQEYSDAYQWDFSKSLDTVPVYWRYSWSNLELTDWEDNEVFHKHYWIERTTGVGETFLRLGDLISPDVFHVASNLRVILDGKALTEGIEYEYDGGLVRFLATIDAGMEMTISWTDVQEDLPYHTHQEFDELLNSDKSTWTNSAGDAFDPSGEGSYQPSDPEAPIEMWINGKYEPSSSYVQTSATSFSLNVTTPPGSGDRIRLKWVRTQDDPNPHVHYKYSYQVQASREDLFRVPFRVSTGAMEVRVNGVALNSEEYELPEDSLLNITAGLEIGDLLEVEYYRREYRWRHAVDSRIVSAPVLQNGIDKPALTSTQYETHEFRDGYLYCDYSDAEGFGDIWAPDLFVNESTIANNFGTSIGFERDNSPEYLYGTRGMWNVFWHGPAINNVETGAKIVLNVPVSPSDAVVSEVISNDDGTHTIRLSVGVDIEIPSYLTPIVTAGQALVASQPLADGVWVYDDVRDPEWWRRIPGIHRVWAQFSVTEDSWTGRFDDRGYLDDGGFWDDSGNSIDVDQDTFDRIKRFSFLVLINSSLLQNNNSSANIVEYLENIKPAYTSPITIMDHGVDELVSVTETVSIDLYEEGSS